MGSSSIAPKGLAKESNKGVDRVNILKRKKLSVVHCQGSEYTIKSSGVSSVLMEGSALVSKDHGAALMDAGSLVFSPNGKTQGGEIGAKELAPYGGPTATTSLMDMQDDGIGIVKFLRGKDFFITGATGFLAKGISSCVVSLSLLIIKI